MDSFNFLTGDIFKTNLNDANYYETLSLKHGDYINHFPIVNWYDCVSEYFNIPPRMFSTCAFKISEDKTILEAWVLKGDYGQYDPNELDENGCETWTCLYNYKYSNINHADFNNYIKQHVDDEDIQSQLDCLKT